MQASLIEISLPVLNEAPSLETQVEKVVNFLNQKGWDDISITIADNGSTDGTGEIAQKLVERFPLQLRFHRVDQPGVGKALKQSWSQSSATYVGFMDLDLAVQLKALESVRSLVEENSFDVIAGSRRMSGSKVENRKFVRTFTSFSLNAVLKSLLGTRFSDAMCGFKFVRRNWIVPLINRFQLSDGWFFSAEILIRAEWENKELKEIPVHWVDDRNSKVKIFKTSKDYLGEICRLRREKRAL